MIIDCSNWYNLEKWAFISAIILPAIFSYWRRTVVLGSQIWREYQTSRNPNFINFVAKAVQEWTSALLWWKMTFFMGESPTLTYHSVFEQSNNNVTNVIMMTNPRNSRHNFPVWRTWVFRWQLFANNIVWSLILNNNESLLDSFETAVNHP